MTLNYVKMEYVQKHRKYLKRTEREDSNGVKIPGSGQRTKGIKKGVLLAGINKENQLVIGYSLCHKSDLFDHIGGEWIAYDNKKGHIKEDYVGGQKRPGFGVELAAKRAELWKNKDTCVITGNEAKSFPSENIVFIPESIKDQMANFIFRCSLYYKDKTFPVWAASSSGIKSDS